MSIYNMDRIFRPDAVAVVGASEKEGTIGWALMNNLIKGRYPGKLFPVNPRYHSIMGLNAYPSLSAVGATIDLAIIATPIAKVPTVVRECVEVKIGGAIIISAGGKEIGPGGRQLELDIKREAEKGGLRIIGPNCMGVICAGTRLNASFARQMPLPGKLAFISQSGAICAAILDLSLKEEIGLRHFVSIGSMLDVDFGDLINYLGHDPEVSSIVLYIENLTNIRKFMSAARAVSRVKPIVVLKAGRSKAGAQAAASHTGALAGADEVYDAAFKRAGIVRVDTIEELFDCAELMAKQPLPAGPGLAIMTNGGGPGVMATDALASFGLEPVSLAPETLKRLDAFLPSFWSRGNPMDILGDATPERWQKAIEVCLSAREFNALVIIFVPQAMSDALTVAEAVGRSLQNRRHLPIFAVWMGGESVEEARGILNSAGIATYETPERAIYAFVTLYLYARNLEMLQEVPPKFEGSLSFDRARVRAIVEKNSKDGSTLLDEIDSKTILDAYGIPVNRTEVARTSQKAVTLAREIGFPVAMKVYSPQITHKSDADGVQLNLRNEKDIEEGFSKIMANARRYNPDAELLGVTIQPMVKRTDYELILGSKRDADFGPVILFGMGGIMTEILKDRALALPPLNRLLARRLMEGTKIYQMMKGYRNRPRANLECIEEILIRLSQLITDFPEIYELDINPMILLSNEAVAVDARIVLKSSEVASPHHLAISPYPNQYEMTMTTKAGLRFFVRAIKPEDAPLLEEFFYSLSPRTVYYRFFSPMKTLPKRMLALFTQIDYDRDMALVAVDQTQEEEKLLGVSRLMRDPDGKRAEFSVVVADAWQGKGIGASLMERLILIAKERGVETLWGLVLAENTQMLSLGKKLGFSISRVPEANQYQLKTGLGSDSNGV